MFNHNKTTNDKLYVILIVISVVISTFIINTTNASNLRATINSNEDGKIPDDELRAVPPIPVLHEMPSRPRSASKNLTVIVLPHSHDDTGWQRTVDQYYVEEVRYIYDSVVAALALNPLRKFVFVETAFFIRWWREQELTIQETVRKLFKNGQLEFINGGWCMADDASPNWDAFIDQVTFGHRYIADTLGAEYLPKFAWHIDPFGLSSSYSSFFKSMNFSAWVFNRVDTRLKDLWHNETRLQFHWEFDSSGADIPGIFSHVLDTHYGAPSLEYKGQQYHFDWEVFGGLGGGENPGSQWPVSAHGKPPSPFYNGPSIDDIAEAFVALVRLRAQWYKLGPPYQNVEKDSGVILVPFGDDMKFQNANKQYSNMDRLMKRINERFDDWNVDVRYGTLGDYFKMINMEQQKNTNNRGKTVEANNNIWPNFDQDFFPLGTNNNIYTSQVNWTKSADANMETDYWTGHYTTRPLMKSLVARAGHAKHTAEIAASIFCAKEDSKMITNNNICGAIVENNDLLTARSVTSVVQHHDSITGTSKPEVTRDLDVRLVASAAASQRMLCNTRKDTLLSSLDNNNVVTPGKTSISIWNGMVQDRVNEHIVVELDEAPTKMISVVDASTGKKLPSTIVPPVPTKWKFKGGDLSNSYANSTSWTIIFIADFPALSHSTFHVTIENDIPYKNMPNWACGKDSLNVIDSDLLRATFDKTTKRLSSIIDLSTTFTLDVTQEYAEYHSTKGSSAYQFLPNRTIFPFGESYDVLPAMFCTFNVPGVVSRVAQTYAEPHHLREIISLYNGKFHVETTTEFSMSIPDRELVTRYKTNIDNTEPNHYFNSTSKVDHLPVFETDSNGYLMMRRVTNKTAWVETAHEDYFHVARPVAGNFYPLSGSPGAIRINGKRKSETNYDDDTSAVAFLTDTAHGAAALQMGWFEVMLGRRVDEKSGISVNDTDRVTANNWMIVSNSSSEVARIHRELASSIKTPLIPIMFPTSSVMQQNDEDGGKMKDLKIASKIPNSIHLLSLDRVGVETTIHEKSNNVLLRVANIYQKNEGPHATDVSFKLSDLLLTSGICISESVEVPLNGVAVNACKIAANEMITLSPLQIRTFDVVLKEC